MAATDTIIMTQYDAVDKITKLFDTYEKKWYVFVNLINEIENGENVVNDKAKFWNVDIPIPPYSISHFYLNPIFKWDTNGKSTLCNTQDELVDKISKWELKISNLEAFIRLMTFLYIEENLVW